jgi:aminoglycoside 3'-phosphotransferase-2
LLTVRKTWPTLAEALLRIHAVPSADCSFAAGWSVRLLEAEDRLHAGLIDESDFDEDNQGRSALDILKELQAFPPLPQRHCFTHGDATLENFLTQDGRLSGVVDLGRAGITHPAQDWALALRSMRGEFGMEGEQRFRQHIPLDCEDEALLRRFCLLDELF